jgi:hypothetical protein
LKPLHLLFVAGPVTLVYVVYLISTVAAEGPLPPHPINMLVLMALATACAVLTSMWSAGRLRDVQRANAEHFDARLDSLANQMAEVLALVEQTQDVRRSFPTTYRAVASGPVALPAPDTVAAIRRLAHKVTRSD